MRKIIFIAILLATFSGISGGLFISFLSSPQDDSETRWKFFHPFFGSTTNSELRPLCDEYGHQQNRLRQVSVVEIPKIFGLKLNEHPTNRVLPIFTSGIIVLGEAAKSVDFHSVGNIGFVELYYGNDRTKSGQTNIYAVGIYLHADDKFVPMKSTNDLPKRLEWEKPKFEALKKWLDEHLPKK